jgi:two-component system, LytTR family, response regulator
MESFYSCLIIDDEYPAHDVIKALLNTIPNLAFAKSCYNGEEALLEINSNHYDIVFLDVNIPIINGIDLLKKLESKPAVIMTTAYTNFAFEAYEHDAVDYLQKPISEQRFSKAIIKAIDYIKNRKLLSFKTISFKIDGIVQKVNPKDIIYLQSMGNYTKFYLRNYNKPVVVNKSLSSQLLDLNSKIFIQIHRTCIVNKSFIQSRKENILILQNNVQLPIGRKYKHLLSSDF